MLEVPLLETTAEIAIALAGFVGIFLALASREGRLLAADVMSIRSIVSCSVSPVFYAALPFVAFSLGLAEPELWRVSSGVVSIVSLYIWRSVMVSMRRWPKEERVPQSGYTSTLAWLLGIVALLCHLLNVVAWPFAPSAGLYLLAVWLVILIAALYFVDLIFKRVL